MTLRNTMSVAGSQRGPPTILSHEDSPIDEKVFDWDNDIVHAAAYRRALHHNVSKQRMGDKPPPQPRGSVQIHIGSDDGKDEFTPSPSLTPSRESRALPYENSGLSKPVKMLYRPGNKTYVPLSSQSGVASERHRPLTELGKKTFWSSWTQKRSSRNVNSLTPTGSNPGTPSSSSTPGSHRGKRGFENSSHASIDFGSENGLSAPSLVRAAQAGSVMEVEMLLNNGADVESVHQQSGRTALAVASQYVRSLLHHHLLFVPLPARCKAWNWGRRPEFSAGLRWMTLDRCIFLHQYDRLIGCILLSYFKSKSSRISQILVAPVVVMALDLGTIVIETSRMLEEDDVDRSITCLQ